MRDEQVLRRIVDQALILAAETQSTVPSASAGGTSISRHVSQAADLRQGGEDAFRRGDDSADEAQLRQSIAVEHTADLLQTAGQDGDAAMLRVALRSARLRDRHLLRRVLKRFISLHAYSEIEQTAEALVRLDEVDECIVQARAAALIALGDVAGADQSFEAAREWLSSPELTRVLVLHYRFTGRPTLAWSAILAGDDSLVDSASLRGVARLLWRDGHVSDACSAYNLAADRAPNHADIQRRRRIVASEARVLQGLWQAPPLPGGTIEPVPGRVVHVVGKSLPYVEAGYTIRTQAVAISQREAGLDPHVVSQYGFPGSLNLEALAHETIDGIPYHRLTSSGALPDELDVRLSHHTLGLANAVRRLQPMVLHAASDYRNAVVALAVGATFDIPVVYEVRGFWEETWVSTRGPAALDTEAYRLKRERELQAMLAAARVVTLSEGMRDELVTRGVPATKIAIVPNAVDIEAFRPVSRDQELAGDLGIAPHEVVLGYISSFFEYEGIRYLIDAIALLVKQGKPVRGLLVGDGPDFANLKAHANRLELSDRIVFTGRIPHTDILRYYGLIDIFVVPRTADRVSHLVTPLKPLEAMATARAVVVSGVDALREMIVEGETGLVFRPEDAEHFATVVEPLIDDRERRLALGREARTWVSKHRTWSQNGQRFLDLYQSMGLPMHPTVPPS